MKKIFYIPFIYACATQQPLPTPLPCPNCPPPTVVKIHDTINKFLLKDTSIETAIIIYPLTGDNYPQLQAAIDYQIATPGVKVYAKPGHYLIAHPLIYAKIVGGNYVQVTPQFEGAVNSKNVPIQYATWIESVYGDRPALLTQLAKGGYFKNVCFTGTYHKPDNMSIITIDTLTDWTDGQSRFNPTSPYCGIAIDPFSDPVSMPAGGMYPGLESYYLSGMNRSGSTAVNFEGITISSFVVGFIITPGAQLNGEIIHLDKSRIGSCFVAYAMCQAQSKQCEVNDFELWGQCHTGFDNIHWGVRHGDGAGSPQINGANIAGVYQIFDIASVAFHTTFKRLSAEGIFKFGRVGANAGAAVYDSEIEFQDSYPGYPSPDVHIWASSTIFENCVFRMYGSLNSRIVVQGYNNTFIGGSQNGPPLWKGVNGQGYAPAFMGIMTSTGAPLWKNDYDTAMWSTTTTIHVDNSFNGYFIGSNTKLKPGDALVQVARYEDILPQEWCYSYLVGYISRINQDTVFLQNIGYRIKDRQSVNVTDIQMKTI